MELWIRSQDKKKLVKCESISVGGYKSHKDETALWCGQFNCGTYKTEKRALEVLDEIQNKIRFISENPNGYYVKDNEEWNKYDKGTFMMPSNVYEMPKD